MVLSLGSSLQTPKWKADWNWYYLACTMKSWEHTRTTLKMNSTDLQTSSSWSLSSWKTAIWEKLMQITSRRLATSYKPSKFSRIARWNTWSRAGWEPGNTSINSASCAAGWWKQTTSCDARAIRYIAMIATTTLYLTLFAHSTKITKQKRFVWTTTMC